jgi:GAF domain-containing protein
MNGALILIKTFFSYPAITADREQTRVARILHTLLIIGLVSAVLVTVILLIIVPAERKPLVMVMQATQIPLLLGLIWLNRVNQTRIAATIYVFINFLIVSFSFIFITSNPQNSTGVLAFAIVLALASLLLTPASVYAYFGLTLIVIAGASTAIDKGLLTVGQSSSNTTTMIISYATIYLVLSVILSVATSSYHRATQDVITNEKLLTEKNTELETTRAQLEKRIQERSQALEKRNRQLQAAADAGKAITSIRNLRQLLEQTCDIISERFGFYHVGVFLLDPAGEYAILQAANSKGGKKMLERKHRLKVGELGIVGNVTQSGQARIALDVGYDAVFFNNPDLPETHSEMALPITTSNTILGALDVQSTEVGAFTNDDIATLQILADQLAIGIQNARLFEENRAALDLSRRAYGETSRADWQKLLKTQGQFGFIGGRQGNIQPVTSSSWEEEALKAIQSGNISISKKNLSLGIPVKIRGQAIGAIRMRKQDENSEWSQDELAMAGIFAEQLSNALEGARLYQDAQTRAAHESVVSEISARINATPNIQSILKETVQELGQVLGKASVSFQLITPQSTTDKVE